MLLLEYTQYTLYIMYHCLYIPGTEYLGLSTADIHGRTNVLWNEKIYSRFCLQDFNKILGYRGEKLKEQIQNRTGNTYMYKKQSTMYGTYQEHI
jgi:hypothetical protein